MQNKYKELYSNFPLPILMISGPSGVGKSTLVHCINSIYNSYVLAISCTTREQNIKQEEHGKHYYFISTEEFLKKKDNGEFAETNPYMKGSMYGTPWSEFSRIKSQGKVPALDIDINGVLQLDAIIPREKTFRLYLTVSEKEQWHRLLKRGRDSIETIKKRVEFGHKEKEQLKKCLEADTLLFNNVVEYDNVDKDLFANRVINTLLLGKQSLI